MNPRLDAELHKLASQAYAQGDAMTRSFSGADQADSELYYGAGRVYVAIAKGTDLEEAIAAEDRRWRAYAEENHRKVNEAPKFKRGPSRGHSVISHRYVYSEGFVSQAIHIRQMVRILREKNPD